MNKLKRNQRDELIYKFAINIVIGNHLEVPYGYRSIIIRFLIVNKKVKEHIESKYCLAEPLLLSVPVSKTRQKNVRVTRNDAKHSYEKLLNDVKVGLVRYDAHVGAFFKQLFCLLIII